MFNLHLVENPQSLKDYNCNLNMTQADFVQVQAETFRISQSINEQLNGFKILDNDETFDFQRSLGRYVYLKQIVQKLSRDGRSVRIVDTILKAAFRLEDVNQAFEAGSEHLFELIKFKFIILHDLATSCKMSPGELLRMAPKKVFGNITQLIMMQPDTVMVLAYHCDEGESEHSFLLNEILHKSWYHLICKDNVLTFDKLQDTILKLKNHSTGHSMVKLEVIQKNLYHLLAKIARCSENLQTKKTYLQQVKKVFDFKSEQDLMTLYNSKVDDAHHFETLVLSQLMSTFGFGRKHELEAKLMERVHDKTLQEYSVENFLENGFYSKGKPSESTFQKKSEKFIAAIEFLSSQIKRDPSLKNSDFIVCFMEAFNMVTFKKDKKTAVQQLSRLVEFIKTAESVIQQKISIDQCFEFAVITQVLHVLRQAIEIEHLVDCAIYCLQILFNAIGIKQATNFFTQLVSIVTFAYLKFPGHKKIVRYTTKIFEFYFKDKKPVFFNRFKEIQFVLLRQLQENPKIKQVVSLVSGELYSSKADIAKHLKEHVYLLAKSNYDIKRLGVMYVQQLLESPDKDEIRKVLVSTDVLRVVFQGILELEKKSKQAEQHWDLSVLCAKCIAQVGLCHTFVNQPTLLRATNQEAIRGQSLCDEESKDQQMGVPNVIKSDYHNPLINMKYRQQTRDHELEFLACPSLKNFPIERRKFVDFADNLKDVVMDICMKTEEKPKNYFYTVFLLNKIISQHQNDKKTSTERGAQLTKDFQEAAFDEDAKAQDLRFKQDMLMKSVKRFTGTNLEGYQLPPQGNIFQFSIYLISKIDEPNWRAVFEACVPISRKSTDFLQVLMPYLVYYSLRFNNKDESLVDVIGKYINEIFEGDKLMEIQVFLQMFDFFSCAMEQEKQIFKDFIELETKFKYVEKLFSLDLKIDATDPNIANFSKTIHGQEEIKITFQLVNKMKSLLAKFDKQRKNKAAKRVDNFKRCVFNFEDNYKSLVNANSSSDKNFLEFLPNEETMEVFSLQRRLNPEDFENSQFQSFIQSLKEQQQIAQFAAQFGLMQMQQQQTQEKGIKLQVDEMLRNLRVVDDWKQSNWQRLAEWYGDFDIDKLVAHRGSIQKIDLFQPDSEDKVKQFELMLAFIFTEYQAGLKAMLRCSDMTVDDPSFAKYLGSLAKVRKMLNYLYFVLVSNLNVQQGETTYYYKLFLHVTYEVESAIYFLKDVFFKEKDRIMDQFRKDVSKDKRKFEKVYYDFNMSKYFEKLLSWFEERSLNIQSSNESLKLIYYARRVFFSLFDRENEMAFCTMKLAKLHRKTNADMILQSNLFKECEKMSSKIVDFELEFAKFIWKHKNAHEAYQYLQSNFPKIEQKVEVMTKQIATYTWMPKLVYQKAQLLSIELQIKINPRNPNINVVFQEFVKKIKPERWEKPNFRFAQYLDMLDSQGPLTLSSSDERKLSDERRKRNIQKIFYYIESLKCGFKYIWQSLPRALELWFEFQGDNDEQKMQNYMRAELSNLESFKLATALQIFLNRYGHQRAEVRETILIVLSKLAVEYPYQSAWWIFHFHFFDEQANAAANKNTKAVVPKPPIERKEFAKELIKKIIARSQQAGDKIMHCEIIFGDLKKLSEKTAPDKDTTMDIPKSLQNIHQATNLVMPIEENLSPQLPKPNFRRVCMTKALVRTNSEIEEHFPENADLKDGLSCTLSEEIDNEAEYLVKFPAYKTNPVMISCFTQKATIMSSKEKPKKIGIIGTDKKVYNFLLKCDKYGDLRKEQRFIEFAGLCNKLLEMDPEACKRNLQIRTFAIVPLSRNTGLIEWINNTTTLKAVVSEYWKKLNVKGEMQDIKKKAQELKMGDTHTQIWSKVKSEIKPVLGNWMANHYLVPDIWYEARLNFIKSTAIWSMIGYVIGLGDRHGDNILIHQHTGEVTHVDFDCIFEKGAKLKVPEIVPFRLTQNIIDGFGIFREKGVFQKSCEVVLRLLRKNQGNINSYLNSFVHDPLIENSQNIKIEIKDALAVVNKKLQGHIYGTGNELHLTVEDQVEAVILNAINEESLKEMYIGWMPWL